MQDFSILVVDDESKIRRVVCKYLEHEGYKVDEAENGLIALEKIMNKNYDLVLLDVMMPEIDGWTVCQEVRNCSDTRVIMLTARGEEYDKLLGFELGADDYITKPFSLRLMVARVKAVLSRNRNGSMRYNDLLKFGPLCLNEMSHQIFLDHVELKLTPREYELLSFMLNNQNIALSRETLLIRVWGYDYSGDYRTVDTHVRQLRDKLGVHRECLQTVWGTGYKFSLGD